MGLILFLLIMPIVAVAVATYILTRREAVPPYQEPVELNPHWPFPNGPKP